MTLEEISVQVRTLIAGSRLKMSDFEASDNNTFALSFVKLVEQADCPQHCEERDAYD